MSLDHKEEDLKQFQTPVVVGLLRRFCSGGTSGGGFGSAAAHHAGGAPRFCEPSRGLSGATIDTETIATDLEKWRNNNKIRLRECDSFRHSRL